MKLNYNPSSGHVKRDKAIIGQVQLVGRDYVFNFYRFASDDVRAASIDALLPKIRELLMRLP
jgi:hypothetical protein